MVDHGSLRGRMWRFYAPLPRPMAQTKAQELVYRRGDAAVQWHRRIPFESVGL